MWHWFQVVASSWWEHIHPEDRSLTLVGPISAFERVLCLLTERSLRWILFVPGLMRSDSKVFRRSGGGCGDLSFLCRSSCWKFLRKLKDVECSISVSCFGLESSGAEFGRFWCGTPVVESCTCLEAAGWASWVTGNVFFLFRSFWYHLSIYIEDFCGHYCLKGLHANSHPLAERGSFALASESDILLARSTFMASYGLLSSYTRWGISGLAA